MNFTYTLVRTIKNEIHEFHTSHSVTLDMIVAMQLIESLGFHPCHSDQGVHSWFGRTANAFGIERPFSLSVDRWGTAVLSTPASLVSTWVMNAVSERMPKPSEMIIAIPLK